MISPMMPPPTETSTPSAKEQSGKPVSETAAKTLETLHQITAPVLQESAIFDEGAATVALGAVLEAVRLRHGAILAYDGERQSLSLLAQQGLSEQAQAAVRLVRRGVAGVWDMPLHSLLQRRVYIIDRPKENPFVPVLLAGEDQNLLSNLAFIPLYSGGKASGVLLLAGSGARTIREPDILAVREHAKILGAALCRPDKVLARDQEATSIPRAAAEARDTEKGQPAASALARDRAALAARVAELEALVDSLWEPSDSGAAAETERRLAELTHERDRLKTDLAAREFELLNLSSENELHRQRGGDETERARKLALDLTQAREQVAGLLDRERLASQEKERTERTLAELEAHLRDTESRLAETTERARLSDAERVSLTSRLSAAEDEAAEHRKAIAAREQQVDELRAERERLTASLHGTASRAQESQTAQARLREDTTQTISTLQAKIESVEARMRETERERDQLRAVSAGREAVTQEIERETESIRAELAREVERRRAAEDTYASVIRDASELHAEVERAKSERLTNEVEAQKAREENSRLAQEIARLQAGHEAETESARAAKAKTASARRALADAEQERKALRSDLERLREELAAAAVREEAIRARSAAQEEETRTHRAEIEALRQASESAVESAHSASRERDAMASKVAALDERIAALLREEESSISERSRLEEEVGHFRSTLEDRTAEMARLRADADAARAAGTAARKELEAREAAETTDAALREEIERQLSELRRELERSQARGSELTAEIESRRRLEEELRTTHAAARSELKEQQERLRTETEERERLAARLAEMEEVLRGAARDLPPQAHDLDAAATLRATLERSEAARRTAEEAVARLESVVETEQNAREATLAEAEDQRRAARELEAQVEDFVRRLQNAEAKAAAAGRQVEELTADHAAATETARSLAADLGRRTAEIGEVKDRLQSVERDLKESRATHEQAQAQIQSLDEAARRAALEIASLKRQGEIAEEDKRKLVNELDLRLAESKSREERLAEQISAANEERRLAEESIRSFDNDRREAAEALRVAIARGTDAETAGARSRADIDKLTSDLQLLRRKIEALENDLRTAETESARWQELSEKLQGTIDERDREILALRETPSRPTEQPAAAPLPKAAIAPRPAGSPDRPPAAPGQPPAAKRPPAAARAPASGKREILIFDQSGPSRDSLSQLCREVGVEPRTAENGASASSIVPQLVAVNLLSTTPAGLQALFRSRTEEQLRDCPIVIYAAQPGSTKGLLITNIECLFRPLEQERFTTAIAAMIGDGKRVTIIGEELEGVLRLNSWATSAGCSVSSAGDPKQGSELLDIVKPDLIVIDLSRLGAEGAALVVKVRRSARIQGLPLLLLLPPNGTSPTAGLFLKRLAALAEEAPMDLAPLSQRLTQSR